MIAVNRRPACGNGRFAWRIERMGSAMIAASLCEVYGVVTLETEAAGFRVGGSA